MPTTLPERKGAPKPIPIPYPPPVGLALYALIGTAGFSVAMIWATPGAIYLAMRFMKEPTEGQALLSFARFYSIQFTPAVGFAAIALCAYSYYHHRTAHLYMIGALWIAFGGWHWLLYKLAS